MNELKTFDLGKRTPHPLKAELRRRKIRLWMVRNLTNLPEPQLSRYLNRIDPMPQWLEDFLWLIVRAKPVELNPMEKLNSVKTDEEQKITFE